MKNLVTDEFYSAKEVNERTLILIPKHESPSEKEEAVATLVRRNKKKKCEIYQLDKEGEKGKYYDEFFIRIKFSENKELELIPIRFLSLSEASQAIRIFLKARQKCSAFKSESFDFDCCCAEDKNIKEIEK